MAFGRTPTETEKNAGVSSVAPVSPGRRALLPQISAGAKRRAREPGEALKRLIEMSSLSEVAPVRPGRRGANRPFGEISGSKTRPRARGGGHVATYPLRKTRSGVRVAYTRGLSSDRSA